MNNAQYNKNQKAENTDLSDFSGMSGSVAKAKDTKKTIKMLLTYSKKYLPGIIIAVIAAVAGTIIALVGPGKLKVLTNLITEGIPTIIDMPGIVKIGILLIVLYLTSALLNTLQGWIMATVTQKISQKMRIDISRKINRLPMWFYHKNTTGDILSRITNDVDSLGQNLNNSLTTLVTSITMLTGSLIMMFITNWTMTLAAIASVVLGFITMMIIMSKSQKHFDNQQKYLGLINGQISFWPDDAYHDLCRQHQLCCCHRCRCVFSDKRTNLFWRDCRVLGLCALFHPAPHTNRPIGSRLTDGGCLW